MSEEKWGAILAVSTLLIGGTVCTAIVVKNNKMVMASTNRNIPNRMLAIYEEGAHAHRNGVPANANPYIGSFGGGAAETWLNGWIDAKEQR